MRDGGEGEGLGVKLEIPPAVTHLDGEIGRAEGTKGKENQLNRKIKARPE